MLILAFDTSGFSGSVALLDRLRLLGETALDAQKRSAQALAPAIRELLHSNRVEPRQIDLVATTIGPGSFTGLRVGVTTAKTFAYAAQAAVISVSTLEAIAYGVPQPSLVEAREVHTVLDAQRNELFLGRFRVEGQTPESDHLPRLRRIEPDRLVAAAEWLHTLPSGAIISGPGLKRYETQLPSGLVIVELPYREPRASVVGRLAWRDYQAGRRDDVWKLAPVYLRPSYAEEKAITSLR